MFLFILHLITTLGEFINATLATWRLPHTKPFQNDTNFKHLFLEISQDILKILKKIKVMCMKEKISKGIVPNSDVGDVVLMYLFQPLLMYLFIMTLHM